MGEEFPAVFKSEDPTDIAEKYGIAYEEDHEGCQLFWTAKPGLFPPNLSPDEKGIITMALEDILNAMNAALLAASSVGDWTTIDQVYKKASTLVIRKAIDRQAMMDKLGDEDE